MVKKINLEFNKLDALYANNMILVKMDKVFVIIIYNRYKDNLMWNKTKKVLKINHLLCVIL